MADSAFWRDLAVQFSALRDKRRLGAGGANDSMFISALETLAMRGASEIAVAGTSDLLHIWLEELRKQGLPFQSSGQSNEVLSEAELGESIYKGFTDGLCEASVTFCNRREAQAVQAEFEEKQRNNPRNWSQFRQQYEALKSVRELRSEPPHNGQQKHIAERNRSTRSGAQRSGAPMSEYRSELKRGILMQLIKKPNATDLEISRGLDADGTVELPASWKIHPGDRLFAEAYSNPATRRKVEIAISKVRVDLRKRGLLDRR